MQNIPIAAVPSQILTVSLANQTCRIKVYQKTVGLFLDLYVSDALVVGGVLCLDNTKIVRGSYLGFVGELAFIDTQGNEDPTADGLGSRFVLVYVEASEV